MEAGIAEAALRALYVLSHRERDKLKDTHCRYTPYRASGEAKTYIAPALAYEGTLNNVWRLLAAVNTALDQHSSCGTTTDHHSGVTEACLGGCNVEQGTTSG
jgi:hypothetical protein